MVGGPIAPHSARSRRIGGDRTRLDIPPHLDVLIDELASLAQCTRSAVLEWAIWAVLICDGVPLPRTIHWTTRSAWRRLESLVSQPGSKL